MRKDFGKPSGWWDSSMGVHWTSESQVYVSLLEDSPLSCLKTITYIFAIPKYQKVIVAQFTVSYTNFFPPDLERRRAKR